MNSKRVVVTGGAGFIGSNVANYLADCGHSVVAVDNEYLGTPDNLQGNVEYVNADCRSFTNELTKVDVLFHFAALSSRQMHELVETPMEGASVNVEGFINTVEEVRQAGCDTVIYASTSSVYDEQPGSVSDPVTAETAYEASKLARERYAEYYSSMHDMTMIGLRLFSVYQSPTAGEQHKESYANIVSQFAEDISSGTRPVVWGDGEQTRDFTHIRDVVRCCETVMEATDSAVYNVGTGVQTSFNDVIDLINTEFGTDIEPVYEPVPIDNYVYHTQADTSDTPFQWTPKITIDEGVERVCRDIQH